MAVSLSRVTTDVVLALNAGSPGSYTSVVVDPRWTTQQVVDAVLTADALVCAAIFRNANNSRAALFFITQTGLASGATIGNSAGPIASVQFVVTGGTAPGTREGVEWDANEIQNEITNPLGLTLIDPHYRLDSKVIYHNAATIAANSGGGSVSVNCVFPGFTRTTACQASR